MTERRWRLTLTADGTLVDHESTSWDRAVLLAGKYLFCAGESDPTTITIQEQELMIVDHSGEQQWRDIGPACQDWFDCLTRRTS